MAKKAVFIVILITFLVLVYSNGNAKNVPMDEIEKALISSTDIEKLEKGSNRDLMQFLGLDYESLDSYIYYRNTEALSVEELFIVKVKDDSQLSAIKDSIEARIETQTTTYEGYGPTQVAMLKEAVVITKGNYLYYCVSKSSDKYEEVLKDVI